MVMSQSNNKGKSKIILSQIPVQVKDGMYGFLSRNWWANFGEKSRRNPPTPCAGPQHMPEPAAINPASMPASVLKPRTVRLRIFMRPITCSVVLLTYTVNYTIVER